MTEVGIVTSKKRVRQRQGQRERETERETERQRERQRERERERESKKERENKREREREKERERLHYTSYVPSASSSSVQITSTGSLRSTSPRTTASPTAARSSVWVATSVL